MSDNVDPIWNALLQQLSATIPKDASINYKNPLRLAEWRTSGAYTVEEFSSKRIQLNTSPIEFGSVLLTESQTYLDHAAEHQALIWNYLKSDDWMSPAWFVVTTYYWAFFLVMSITRILGTGTWYLDGDGVSKLRELQSESPPREGPSSSAGAGSYQLSIGRQATLTSLTVTLTKKGGRLHDHLWRNWFDLARKLSANAPASSLVGRGFAAQHRIIDKIGDEWPTSLRNLVNYRAGLAYASFRRTRNSIKRPPRAETRSRSLHQIIEDLEGSAVGIRKGHSIEDQLETLVTALSRTTYFLHAVAWDLDSKLAQHVDRLDRRWRQKRENFVLDRIPTGPWPC